MLVAALAGILSLGACVDDKESASVEAIRNAKAKQLEALATKYNAEAEAALIYANADKAIKEAEAAYKRAEAEAMQAEADQQKLLLDKAKEMYALEIEAAKAEAQAAIAKAKKEAQEAEQALLDAADERIAELYNVYAREAGILSDLNRQLLNEKTTLKGLQADLVQAEAYVKQQTIIHNNTIAQKTALLDALKALPANDRAELEAKIEGYNAELKPLYAEVAVKNDAYTKANDAYSDAREDLLPYYGSTSSVKLIEAVKTLRNDYSYSLITYVDYDLTDNKSIDQYSLVQNRVTSIKNSLTSNTVYYKEILGAATVGTTPATGVYVGLEARQDAYKAALDTYNADKTEGNRYAMEAAKAELERYQANELANAKQDLEDANARLAEFNALVATFTGADLTAYNTALADLKKLAEAYEAAEDALNEVYNKISDINDLKNSVSGILAGTTDLPKEIATAELAIATAEQAIANLRSVSDKETAIAYAEEEIAILEAKIAAKKIIVAKAKAALDAALK
ncbi:hypothetical protein D0T87_03700 [Bacteroides sp. 51]|nr:hypothetical protein [Bacteroides sp. 51]